VLPLILYFSINTYINENILSNKDIEINNRLFIKNTSGRIEAWNYSLKNYNYKKIFGYGPQGDRFFLKDFKIITINQGYGDNSSNIFIYTLLSGGIVSTLLLILFFYEILKIFIKNKKLLFFNKNSIYLNFSILCIVFFSIRSLFENSFGLFSVDFLIMCLSVFFITNYTKKIIANDQY
jgi:O-antigen ligase